MQLGGVEAVSIVELELLAGRSFQDSAVISVEKIFGSVFRVSSLDLGLSGA